MQLVTALEEARYETLWEMMNHIWNIEENGFHQLKTYYHAKHCYCHGATEVIWNLLIIGFNMREIYLYRRIHGFIKRGISRKSVSRIFCDDLQTEKVKNILYGENGQELEMIRNFENRMGNPKIHNRCDRGSLCVFFRMEREKAESCRKRGIL